MSTSTTADQITATVTEIMAGELGVPPERLEPDTDLRAVEGADSVKVLRTIAKIERTYDVELDDEVVFSFTRIADVVLVVEKLLVVEKTSAEQAQS